MNQLNADKERIITLVNTWLVRSGLSIEQIVARMQTRGCDIARSAFENRFTTRVNQKPNIPPGWVLGIIAAFTERLTDAERCRADEAIELARLARLPIDQFQEMQRFFPEAEFMLAFGQYIQPLYNNLRQQKSIAYRDVQQPEISTPQARPATPPRTTTYWEDAPDISTFCGRESELDHLRKWIADDGCRFVGILGFGGIGKTSLATKLAQIVQPEFDYLFWKSLHNAPPVEEVINECIHFFVEQSDSTFPVEAHQRLSLLIKHLRKRRCLLILDNVETILQAGDETGSYRDEHRAYGDFFHQLGTGGHRSCLLLTSREKPKELALLEGKQSPVRSLVLEGLRSEAAAEMLSGKQLFGEASIWQQFVMDYSGNPLALKLVAEPIEDIFAGDIATFLENGAPIFTGIRELLDQQFGRLTVLEREVLYWLAIEREAVQPEILYTHLTGTVGKGQFLEALRALRRRSLIEQSAIGLTLQNVVLEYMTERLVNLIGKEILAELPLLLASHALMNTQTKEYIRNSQVRLIIRPIVDQLLSSVDRDVLKEQLLRILVRQQNHQQPDYTGGNIVNFLNHLGHDWHNQDLSGLVIRSAYLKGVDLQDTNLAYADCQRSVFLETFGSVTAVTFSPDGKLVAAGLANGEIRIWEVESGRQFMTYTGHSNLPWSLTFSPDGNLIASSSEDQTVRIWEVYTGLSVAVLKGHIGWVKDVAFSPDGTLLASGSNDHTVRIWALDTAENGASPGRWQPHSVWQAHEDWVWSIAFSADGTQLITAGQDGLLKLWDIQRQACLQIFEGHEGPIRAVVFAPSQPLVVSGSFDQTVRLWDVRTGACLQVIRNHTNLVWSVAVSNDGQMLASSGDDRTVQLTYMDGVHAKPGEESAIQPLAPTPIPVESVQIGSAHKTLLGHKNRVWSVAFSPDNRTLASGGDDQTLRLWDITTGQPLQTLEGYSNQIWSVAFDPTGSTLACGGDDGQVHLWSARQGEVLARLRGHTDRIRSVAFNPDGRWLASGSDDEEIRLWDVQTGRCLRILKGHTNRVWSVAFSQDKRVLASSSEDHTIRLWSMRSGRCIRILRGIHHRIWSVAFNPESNLFASGSDDQTIRLWNVKTGDCLQTLHGHTGRIWSVAFSPDGRLLASGSDDQTIRFWDINSGECIRILEGHSGSAWTVAFSQDSALLASGSDDQTIRLWDTQTGEMTSVLHGHMDCVWAVAFNRDGTLASGGSDETIRQWDVKSGKCLRTLRCDRPYERMNITGITGITESQKATLKLLGAVASV